MEPRVRVWQGFKPMTDADAAQIQIGDKRIDAMPVVINTHEQCIPTAMVGKSNPEQGKLGFP